jgi:hypothetical protein
MNIPINFDKIDSKKFKIGDNEFRIEIDGHHTGDVWVLHDIIWPLCFDIDWANERYDLIKCSPGNGRMGSSLTTNATLTKYLMKDANSFVNSFLKDVVTLLLNSKLI